MYTCRSCLRKALRPFSDIYVSRASESTPSTSKPAQARQYATSGAAVKQARHDAPRGEDHSPARIGRSKNWAVQKELQYLQDPLHIAKQVKRTLDRNDFDHAASITRSASKSAKVAVSWNHLIDYQLRMDRIHTALKLYNEMKKRAQLPNAQTITIILRGLARSSHSKLAVSEAIKLYNNCTKSPRFKPNTIHLNAVLQVCAKAQDLESMFNILDTTNDGLRAPNNYTYTTILNAIRAHASQIQVGDQDEAVVAANKRQAVQRAKLIWNEVLTRWRSGSVVIDEELVCAMGRILLMGDNYKNAESIEDLIDQTMNLERGAKRTPSDSGVEGENGTETKTKAVTTRDQSSRTKASGVSAATYALPGKNSLSMILESLLRTRKTTRALRYWGIFTKNYHVEPDANNWTLLLRAFCTGKNSSGTVAYFKNMPRKLMTPKHSRIAMKACLTDQLNRSAFHNASQVLEIMLSNLKTPDVQTLRIYLRVVYANRRSFGRRAEYDEEGATQAWAKQLAEALENLWEPFKAAEKQCVPVDKGKQEHRGQESNSALRVEVVALARRMIAAYDRLADASMLPIRVDERIQKKRNELNRFVVISLEERAKWDPTFDPKKPQLEETEEDDEDY
ncbi:hypothetical protein F5Y15DRAFT_399174 [Xylariaceae sp. FL0016]|nr:hypothetical protein F5Y15DRAFT_399174 [Xylariaceae sp. FL0016]